MRLRHAVAILTLCCAATAVQGAAVFNLYSYGGTGTSTTVAPGGTLHLWVRLVLTEDTLAGAKYDILLPGESWVLQDRDYGSYNWLVNDGFFDQSVPKDKSVISYPVTIVSSTYNVTPTDPDFHFESATLLGQELAPGTHTVEDFWLQVPTGQPDGLYSIALLNPAAYSDSGDPIASSAGDPFEILVETAIPEPGTLALFGFGLVGALIMYRRRRRD